MGDLRPDARALIRAGKSAFRPQPGDRERVLESLTRTLGEGATLGAVRRTDPPGPASAGPFSSPWVLGGLGALTIGAGVLLATAHPWSTRLPAAAPMSASGPAVEATPPSPAVPSINAEDLPVQRRAEGRSQPPAPSAAARASSDSLPEEVRLLSKAEHQLSGGRADEALTTLAEHERLAARVQSLCALGRVSEARADLARLARSYPGSAQLERARKFCGIGNP